MYDETCPAWAACGSYRSTPPPHAALLHGWVTQPRAAFWGMGSYTVDEVREVYEFMDAWQPTTPT